MQIPATALLGQYGWLILIIASGASFYIKYQQWKKHTMTENANTLFGILFGAAALASGIAQFQYDQYTTLITRAMLLITGLHLILRPIRNVKWSIFVAIVGGAAIAYAATTMYGPQMEAIAAVFDLNIDAWILGGGVFLLAAIPIYFALQFFEALLGWAGNVLDNGLVAIPLAGVGISEGLCLPYTAVMWGNPMSLPYAIGYWLLTGGQGVPAALVTALSIISLLLIVKIIRG